MQLKIYQRLNQLLILIFVSIVVFGIAVVLNFNRLENMKTLIFAFFMLYSLGCYFIFKMIENNWDKRLIQKMAIANQVVVANIREAKPYLHIKDSSSKHYNLWEITVDYYDHDLNRHEYTLFERMNASVEMIPHGTVFLTHDENKPNRKFIIPNVIVSHIESLMPIVQKYEKTKAINIKYLNVYYNTGIVIETYKESLKNQKNNSKVED